MTVETVDLPAYPPFDAWTDWLTLAPGVELNPRTTALTTQVVTDATEWHDIRHLHADHPWCRRCAIRSACAELGVRPPAEAQAALHETVPTAIDADSFKRIKSVFDLTYDEGFNSQNFALLAEETGETPDAVRAIVRYLADSRGWESLQQDTKQEVASRAGRYLLVYGKPPADQWRPTDADDFANEYLTPSELNDLPAPEPLIDGVLTRHAYAILRGRDGTLKSFTALDWAACLATGKPWQGRETRRVRVLYMAGEGVHGISKRLEAWQYAWGTKIGDDDLTVRRSAVNFYRGGPALEELVQRVQDGRYGLVILDTLRRISGAADGNGSEMGVVVDNIDRVRRATADGTVLVISHTDKNDTDTRGFSGIEDDADIVWSAKRDERVLTLENTKNKDGADGTRITLQARPILDSLVLEHHDVRRDDTGELTENDRKLDQIMRDTFPAGASKTALVEASGFSPSSLYASARRLTKNGVWLSSGTAGHTRWEAAPCPDPSSTVQSTETP